MPTKSLTRRMQILRPWLEKDDWAAMTYMLVPHVLREAEQLRIDLVSKPSHEGKAERDRLLKEVQSLMVARAERVRRRQQAASKDKSV